MFKDIPLSLVVSFGSFWVILLHWGYELPCQDKLPEFHYIPILGCIRVLWLVFHPLGLGLDKALFGWNSVTKYESAHTQRSVLTHGPTRNFMTLVPWLLPSSSVTALAFSSSAVLTIFNQIITPEHPQAAFWISQPFSSFLSIATYIGRPWLIQWPPCPYHRDMDSSMQISSNGKKFCAQCSLKFLTKSSTSLQRYCSDVISDGRLGGCSLNLMHIHRSSNRFCVIPVRQNNGAGIYLLVVMLLQSDARDPNSNWVTSNMTPKKFTISPVIV